MVAPVMWIDTRRPYLRHCALFKVLEPAQGESPDLSPEI
jgi:hypothetical protein